MPLFLPASDGAGGGGDVYANEFQWRFNHSAVTGIGIGTPTGGPSAYVTFADSSYGSMATAAGAGATAGFENGGGNPCGFEVRHTGRMTLWMRTGADITACRFWLGLVGSSDAAPNSDTGPNHFAGFRFSTVAPDGGWVGVTKAAGSQTVSSTVAPIAASTAYKLEMTFTDSVIGFSVNGGTEQLITTNLPTTTLNTNIRCYLIATTASARTWYLSRLKLEYGVLV